MNTTKKPHQMSDEEILQQMMLADRMVDMLVAELIAGECDTLSVAAMLCKHAAALIHGNYEDPEVAREVILSAARIMMTG